MLCLAVDRNKPVRPMRPQANAQSRQWASALDIQIVSATAATSQLTMIVAAPAKLRGLEPCSASHRSDFERDALSTSRGRSRML